MINSYYRHENNSSLQELIEKRMNDGEQGVKTKEDIFLELSSVLTLVSIMQRRIAEQWIGFLAHHVTP